MEAVIFGSSSREVEMAASLAARETSVYGVSTDTAATAVNLPGVEMIGDFANRPADAIRAIEHRQPDLVIVQEEKLLFEGLATALRESGFNVFGADQDAATFEQDKSVLSGIISSRFPGLTPRKLPIEQLESIAAIPERCVIRTRNVAGSLTTIVVDSQEKRYEAAELFSGQDVIVEEFVEGTPLTFYVFTNGSDFFTSPPVKTYPFRKNGNQGKKTGGMGAVIAPESNPATITNVGYTRVLDVAECIIEQAGQMERGILQCFSIEVIADGDLVSFIESDVRLGDPEASALCSVIGHDRLGGVITELACEAELTTGFTSINAAAVSIALAPRDYPDAEPGSIEIDRKSLDQLNRNRTRLTLGKVSRDAGASVIHHQGSRIGVVTTTGSNPHEASSAGYEQLAKANLPPAVSYRTDIGM